MSDLDQLHQDLRQNSRDLKELTSELQKHNAILIEVVTDNKHRDSRITDCEHKIERVETQIDGIKADRTSDREEYKPVWDRARQDQSKKDGYINNITWFAIVAIILLITNAISSGAIKPWFSGNASQQTQKDK
jgi:chromosome segregation ATPase